MPIYLRIAATFLIPLLGLGCVSTRGALPIESVGGDPGYRIYDVSRGEFTSLDGLTRDLADAELVVFGELHDDSIAHHVQHQLLDRLSARGSGILGLEMFERDVQAVLASYVGGSIGEENFLAESRAWSNYRTDYRPLVELARERNWEVVATNLPQRLASAIARDGLAALDTLESAERRWAAVEMQCPEDEYWRRFVEAMYGAGDAATTALAHASDDSTLRRTYQAQCARDETMAEEIVANLDRARVVHINGSFHSDHYLGLIPRVLRRDPAATIRSISAIPVDEMVNPPIAEHVDRADYIIFTRARPRS